MSEHETPAPDVVKALLSVHFDMDEVTPNQAIAALADFISDTATVVGQAVRDEDPAPEALANMLMRVERAANAIRKLALGASEP